jgi:hypothetical protein
MLILTRTLYGTTLSFQTKVLIEEVPTTPNSISSKDFNDAINDSSWTSEGEYRTYRIRMEHPILTIACDEVGISKQWEVVYVES